MHLPINYKKSNYNERRMAREEYAKMQNGLCWYCGQSLLGEPDGSILSKSVDKNLFPDNFFEWPVHLHHSHKTGLTIGTVHCYCNAVLWQYCAE